MITIDNKETLKARLKMVIGSQKFYEFYVIGPWDIQISGDFERGTEECAINDDKVEKYLDSIIENLIKQ